MIFFTSDLHFSSDRTRTLSRRPFGHVDEVDGHLLYLWNRDVGPNDEVYILGDFGDFSYFSGLSGKKYLLPGNHDQDIPPYIRQIHKGVHTIGGHDCYLCHEPMDCNLEYFNLFGHVHQLSMAKTFGLNVGTDCHHFAPIPLDVVLWYKEAITHHYDENVFI